MNIRYLKASLFIHILPIALLLLLSGNGGNSSTKGKKEKEDKKKIADKADPIEVKIVTMDDLAVGNKEKEKEKEKEHKKNEKSCKDSYGGIGIYYNYDTGRIIKAYPGYPAYEAGIRDGDFLIGPRAGDISGEEGTAVSITYEGSNGVKTISVIRGKICLEENKD